MKIVNVDWNFLLPFEWVTWKGLFVCNCVLSQSQVHPLSLRESTLDTSRAVSSEPFKTEWKNRMVTYLRNPHVDADCSVSSSFYRFFSFFHNLRFLEHENWTRLSEKFEFYIQTDYRCFVFSSDIWSKNSWEIPINSCRPVKDTEIRAEITDKAIIVARCRLKYVHKVKGELTDSARPWALSHAVFRAAATCQHREEGRLLPWPLCVPTLLSGSGCPWWAQCSRPAALSVLLSPGLCRNWEVSVLPCRWSGRVCLYLKDFAKD